MRPQTWHPLLTAAVLVLCIACAETSAQPADQATPQTTVAVPTKDPAPQWDPVTSEPAVVRFVATLQERGISVEPQRPSGLVFLTVPGHVYKVPSGIANIHLYPTEAQAIEEAARVVPVVDNPNIDWIDFPHFYRCDSLIVGYYGKSKPVVRELTSLCGPQFAGY